MTAGNALASHVDVDPAAAVDAYLKAVAAGAIGGPIVDLDMRTFYLRDIQMIGCTAWDEPVFPNLVGYIERGEIRPLVAKTFPLAEIVQAQQEFLTKTHVGKFVLIP